LVVSEPEKAVLQDRPTPYRTELVAMECSLRETGRVREITIGIHRVIAQEPESVAVKAVGARLRDGIHNRATELAVLGVKAVGDEAKFLDGVQVRNKTRAKVAALADVSAVHQERIGGFALAVYGDVAGVQSARNRAVLLDRLCGTGCNASLQAQKIDVAAAVQRQCKHFLGVDNVAELRVFGLHLHRVGFHADLFRHGSHVEGHIQVQLVVYLYFN
jgi:hypothetical protein